MVRHLLALKVVGASLLALSPSVLDAEDSRVPEDGESTRPNGHRFLITMW